MSTAGDAAQGTVQVARCPRRRCAPDAHVADGRHVALRNGAKAALGGASAGANRSRSKVNERQSPKTSAKRTCCQTRLPPWLMVNSWQRQTPELMFDHDCSSNIVEILPLRFQLWSYNYCCC